MDVENKSEELTKVQDRTISQIAKALYGFNLTVDIEEDKFTILQGTGLETFVKLLLETRKYSEIEKIFRKCVLQEYIEKLRNILSLENLKRNKDKTGLITTIEYPCKLPGMEEIQWQEISVFMGVDEAGKNVANILGRNVTPTHSQENAIKNFLNLSLQNTENKPTVDHLIKYVGEYFNADRAYVFENDEKMNCCSNTYEWCAKNVVPQIENLQNIPMEMVKPWKDALLEKGSFYLSVNDEYSKNEPIIYEILEPQGIDSVMIAPFMIEGNFVGFFGIDNPRIHVDQELFLSVAAASMCKEILIQRDREKNLEYTAKLQHANAAKSEFLARMSHDIRTPLNGIIGLLEIDERHPDDRKLIDENRAKARVAANHLLSLISDVLNLSKMDDENVQLAKEPFSLIALENDVMTISQMRATELGITLHHEPCEDRIKDPYVYGSPLHVRQILLNIISNGIKYNKAEGRISCISETTRIEDRVMYKVVISDTGIGMSQEFLEHLFEPFSQERTDARSTYQGTGLGMAIVKSLIDKMGGTICVESSEGKGSTFTVTIPFDIAKAENLPQQNVIQTVNLKDVKILLVEDNELNMEIAKVILEDSGAIITEACNGKEAVDIYNREKEGAFNIILMDLMMPVMNGFEATECIRKSGKKDSGTIPIIAMTANAFTEDVQKCLDAGMNGHIAKPIKIDELMRTIFERLSRSV